MTQFDIRGIVKAGGSLLGKGMLILSAPNIFKGVLVALIRERNFDDIGKMSELVNTNANFWGMLGSDYQEALKIMTEEVGNIDWLTTDWAILALKDDYPALASLFLGWKKANNWLARQIEIIKKEIVA